MIHRPLIRLAAVAVVVPLLALSPAAHAEKWVAKDKRGDVTLGSYSDNLLHPAPQAATADITRTVVAHRAEHLVVRVKVRQLFRDGPKVDSAAGYVRLGPRLRVG
ncbi:hypothetical protein [Nocardioides sp.]|uniref:hypothetical protein n=1 Tax=Nocardioides sp. TaxID=35761 RepID=UPI0027331D56|nr:hypothetical protein [Nocardioides sp.]MDP3892066.1 hypothetical protein [Nocardioides sp.]